MRMFEEQIIVSKHDLDELNHVNNIIYIKWILGVAKKHWKKLVSNEITNLRVPIMIVPGNFSIEHIAQIT